MENEKHWHARDLICFLPLLCAGLLHHWAGGHPAQVERYWQSVYPLIDLCLSTLSSALPISPTEIGLGLLLATTAALLGRGLHRWRRRTAPGLLLAWRGTCRGAAVSGAIALWFMLGWGLNYHRPPIAQRWSLSPGAVDPSQIQALAAEAVAIANQLAPPAPAEPWPISRDARRLAQYVRQIAREQDSATPLLQIPAHIPLAWPVLQWLGIDGVTSPFFHEVLLNPQPNSPVRGAVLAHELAHAAGYAREDAASMVGLLACKRSRDPADRYAYAMYLLLQLSQVKLANGKPAVTQLNPRPLADLRAELDRLRRRESPLTRAQQQLNNLYLKTAGDPHGTSSYSRVIILLAARQSRRKR